MLSLKFLGSNSKNDAVYCVCVLQTIFGGTETTSCAGCRAARKPTMLVSRHSRLTRASDPASDPGDQPLARRYKFAGSRTVSPAGGCERASEERLSRHWNVP